jgi:hypothetical protein
MGMRAMGMNANLGRTPSGLPFRRKAGGPDRGGGNRNQAIDQQEYQQQNQHRSAFPPDRKQPHQFQGTT